MTSEDEKAWNEVAQRPEFVGASIGGLAYRVFMVGRDSQRSRIAALEAVIEKAPHDRYCHSWAAVGFPSTEYHECDCWKSSLVPSTVLDQMIREAKAEAERDALRAQLDGMTTEWGYRDDDFDGHVTPEDEEHARRIGERYEVQTVKRLVGPWVEVTD